MNKLLLFLAGAAIGAAGGYFAPHAKDPVAPPELVQARTEIARLQSQLSTAEASVSKLTDEKATVAAVPAADGPGDINKLFNDAKPLLKTFTNAFEPQRKEMMKRMVEEQLKRLTTLANLTPEQQAAFKSFLEGLSEQEQAKWKNMLEGKGSLDQMFKMGRGGPGGPSNQQKNMDEWAKQNLVGEQATAYETSRLTEKAKQLTDSANTKLDGLTTSLNLDESQKDRVFHILVQTDKNYDPAMKLEGIGNEAPITGTREEAIAAVLNPEQKTKYEQEQQEKKQKSGGFFKALGLDPSLRPPNPDDE